MVPPMISFSFAGRPLSVPFVSPHAFPIIRHSISAFLCGLDSLARVVPFLPARAMASISPSSITPPFALTLYGGIGLRGPSGELDSLLVNNKAIGALAYLSVQLMRWWSKLVLASQRPDYKRAGV